MFIIKDLSLTLPEDKKTVLKDIHLEFEQGEFVGVVGPSGGGKSMLLRCLSLRESWTSGTFKMDEQIIINGGGRASMKYRSQFAYLEQNPELYGEKTALKNVLIGQKGQTPWWRRLTGMVRSDDYMGAMDELERFGLLDKAKLPAGKLSGGEKQRVAISRALVHGANVLAADEPVVGLDPQTADKVLSELKSLCQNKGKTVITVLPVDLAERWCTRLWGIKEGRLLWDITGRRLTSAEKNSI
ncbi:phosphonate ABC transporter ATP-binding protein [Paenibacillus sp. CAA11]|uniref:phosphonate ABC transporter ATP-binding protein n=1 Tax=Paenibacillus sp. CAA11 TaxID=1532905 RepID=UPI000D34682A|nr:ATP-binding cassette domain-containing protein [Paenibacillus sp. CAA11]AWB44834.1 phosphonate ABC transporter ATP-binding protein [Paenibacillus sp. CAA11]